MEYHSTTESPEAPFPDCPTHLRETYCLNGGKCFSVPSDADEPIPQAHPSPHCICGADYHGRRCEYLFNSELYGFMVEQKEGTIPWECFILAGLLLVAVVLVSVVTVIYRLR